MCLCMQPGDRDVAMLLLSLSKPACIDRLATRRAALQRVLAIMDTIIDASTMTTVQQCLSAYTL